MDIVGNVQYFQNDKKNLMVTAFEFLSADCLKDGNLNYKILKIE